MVGAGSEDRTRIISLEGWGSTIELYPPNLLHYLLFNRSIPPWWRGVDSNHRSLRVRFTVWSLWPLGNPSQKEALDSAYQPRACQINFLLKALVLNVFRQCIHLWIDLKFLKRISSKAWSISISPIEPRFTNTSTLPFNYISWGSPKKDKVFH